MPDAVKYRRGFSLAETLLAMMLMVTIVTALSGYQRALITSLAASAEYRQLWRQAWQQTQLASFSPPANWQAKRMQTTQAGCVSISVTLSSPRGRQGNMTRLHCPNR
ncbi:prepilin-type N-terminal cleavage/methylation domain-containing protein [Intestinirhabdus alba]|jgi:prepilin peptidase dependent protein C|uniref:Prepilin-type N-terminal cleavage/methylation domain-containing protein n=1 Tax=Intestinirhabdus alba TaxID=2899544 RepID=A0A6L6II13_9ENTR|nr:prepilin-type N-terminal cleavage/methylation domain-containing protein [Intestinirhabdus alba]MTH45308.1 prepilin-type N-terminal cleavage/methylation domain-containing protein [Intestinirhabdus alba]